MEEVNTFILQKFISCLSINNSKNGTKLLLTKNSLRFKEGPYHRLIRNKNLDTLARSKAD